MNWNELEQSCKEIHGCSNSAMMASKNKKKQREIQKKAETVERTGAAFREVSSRSDFASMSREEVQKSVIAILAPFLLKLVFSFLMSQFQGKVIDWYLDHTKPS